MFAGGLPKNYVVELHCDIMFVEGIAFFDIS
jgi:hypothetical protein